LMVISRLGLHRTLGADARQHHFGSVADRPAIGGSLHRPQARRSSDGAIQLSVVAGQFRLTVPGAKTGMYSASPGVE
jgi:hypothetical protein